MKNELKDIIKSVRKYIELEELAGTREFLETGKRSRQGQVFQQEDLVSGQDLSLLKKEALSCAKCDLFKTRTHVVFGAGNPGAKLMFIGEAPGMQEDLQGFPFVGRAGKLLTRIIEAIGLKRKDVYIANILKCRPPDNRNPLPAEILTCEGYLTKQIKLIKPEVMCALGKFAAQTLLRSTESISSLRGKFYGYGDAKLMPTFHPAYLLRNPQDKRLVWEDMKKIRKELSE